MNRDLTQHAHHAQIKVEKMWESHQHLTILFCVVYNIRLQTSHRLC